MIIDDFKEIERYAHMWNWLPDWDMVVDIYRTFPDSYSVLTPFAYTYLEELIRSTTSQYGIIPIDKNGNRLSKRKTDEGLINLAISENRDKPEYIKLLKTINDKYYKPASELDRGNNRHSTIHGFMHSGYWSKESFEELIHDIAELSKYGMF